MDKTLYIMQGISGSGKSTIAKLIQEGLYPQQAVILSTDNYWYLQDPLTYNFDVEKIPIAHQWNQNLAHGLMKAGIPHLIIDNTNLQQLNANPYMEMAKEFGYQVQIVSVSVNFLTALERNNARSEDRRIPTQVMAGQVGRWERLNPWL